MLRAIQAAPRFKSRIALLHRHGVEGPLDVTGFRISRLRITRLVEIVTSADDDVVADHYRRHGREILLVEVGDFLMPALLTRPRIETHQIIVGGLHVKPVAPHSKTAIPDMSST